MTTAAGFANCDARHHATLGLKARWADLDGEAHTLHRLVQMLAERVGKVNTSVAQLKEAGDSIPVIASDLSRASELIQTIATAAVGAEDAVVQLEVERAREVHLQQSISHHRAVEQALQRNEHSIEAAEEDFVNRVQREKNMVVRKQAELNAEATRDAVHGAVLAAATTIFTTAALEAKERPKSRCSFCTTVYSSHLKHCPMCGEKTELPKPTEEEKPEGSSVVEGTEAEAQNASKDTSAAIEVPEGEAKAS